MIERDDDEDVESPMVEVVEDEYGDVVAKVAIETLVADSNLRQRDAVNAIAACEFTDIEAELKSYLQGTGRAKDRRIHAAVTSREAGDGNLEVR